MIAAWTVVRESLDPGAARRGSSIALDLEFRRVRPGGTGGGQAGSRRQAGQRGHRFPCLVRRIGCDQAPRGAGAAAFPDRSHLPHLVTHSGKGEGVGWLWASVPTGLTAGGSSCGLGGGLA